MERTENRELALTRDSSSDEIAQPVRISADFYIAPRDARVINALSTSRRYVRARVQLTI